MQYLRQKKATFGDGEERGFGMITIGIDPAWAKRNAWALIENEVVLDFGFMPKGSTLRDEDIDFHGAEAVWIEGQYPRNFGSASKLAMVVGKFQMVAQREMRDFHIIQPVTWMSAYYVQRMNKINRENAVANIASYYTNKDLRDEYDKIAGTDLHCAILIGLFGSRRVYAGAGKNAV